MEEPQVVEETKQERKMAAGAEERIGEEKIPRLRQWLSVSPKIIERR